MILSDECTLAYTRDGATMSNGAEVAELAPRASYGRRLILPADDIGPDITAGDREFSEVAVGQYYSSHDATRLG